MYNTILYNKKLYNQPFILVVGYRIIKFVRAVYSLAFDRAIYSLTFVRDNITAIFKNY